MDENKDIINVKKSSIEADFPIGQKLSINGINCVVAKRGSCPNCIVCIPNVHRDDVEITCEDLACLARERKDRTGVHFKEI